MHKGWSPVVAKRLEQCRQSRTSLSPDCSVASLQGNARIRDHGLHASSVKRK